MKLMDLQDYLADAIISDNTDMITPFIKNTDSISTGERIAVYQNNYRHNLTNILTQTYPVILKLIGQDCFASVISQFIKIYPPKCANLNVYGGDFSDFVSTLDILKPLHYLPDMARLEWCMNQAYFANDDISITAYQAQNMGIDHFLSCNLSLCDNVDIITSQYPIYDIWHFCTQDNSENPLDINASGQNILVNRVNYQANIQNISSDDYKIFDGIKNGQTLEFCFEHILNENPDFDISHFLIRYLNQGLFKMFN